MGEEEKTHKKNVRFTFSAELFQLFVTANVPDRF